MFRSDICRGGKAWHGTPGQMQVRGSCRSCGRPQSYYCTPWWLHGMVTSIYRIPYRVRSKNMESRRQRSSSVPWSSNVTLRVAASRSPVAGLTKGSERGRQTNGEGGAATVDSADSLP